MQYLVLQLRFDEAARIPRRNTVPNKYTWDKSSPKKNQEQYSLQMQNMWNLGPKFGLPILGMCYIH